MFKQGIKNYFYNLKYIFTSLGTLFLGCVVGVSILLPGIGKVVNTLVTDVINIVGEAQVDFDALKDSLYSAVTALDWSNPWGSILTMLNSEWLTVTFNDCLAAFLGDYANRAADIEAAINVAVSDIGTCVIAAVVWALLGFFGGHLLIKFLVRRNVARRTFWKYFLSSFLDSLFSSTILAAVAYLFTVWTTSVFISLPVTMIVTDFVALVKAYLVHGYRKVAAKEIVNGRNIGMLILTDTALFAITVVFMFAAFGVFGGAAGLCVSIALFDVTFIVIGLNAESYVKRVALTSVLSPVQPEPVVSADLTETVYEVENTEEVQAEENSEAVEVENTSQAGE